MAVPLLLRGEAETDSVRGESLTFFVESGRIKQNNSKKYEERNDTGHPPFKAALSWFFAGVPYRMEIAMKRMICLLLGIGMAVLTAGCSTPDSLQLDLSQGCGNQVKLLHLNARTEAKRQRIEEFASILEDAQPLEKELSLFAYYPDYLLVITRDGQKTSAIVDINGDFVDFLYPGGDTIYRSAMSAQDLKKLLHQHS